MILLELEASFFEAFCDSGGRQLITYIRIESTMLITRYIKERLCFRASYSEVDAALLSEFGAR